MIGLFHCYEPVLRTTSWWHEGVTEQTAHLQVTGMDTYKYGGEPRETSFSGTPQLPQSELLTCNLYDIAFPTRMQYLHIIFFIISCKIPGHNANFQKLGQPL